MAGRGCHKRRGKREGKRSSNFSLRSIELEWSSCIGPRFKFRVLVEGNAWTPKSGVFVGDSSEEFGKSKVLGLGNVPGTSYIFFYTPRGTDFSYFGLFSILGAV